MNTKLRLLFLSISFSMLAIGQEHLSGTIVDTENGDPVAFAYVLRKSDQRCFITNEDGYFEMTAKASDSLVIRFLGYERKTIPAFYFKENKVLKLSPISSELGVVEVHDKKDYFYDLFFEARSKYKSQADGQAKTYFSMETIADGQPAELLECYYNGAYGPAGIEKLALKNGRIGMSPIEGAYFANLNTTEIIADYNLIGTQHNRLPPNPFHISKFRFKKAYTVDFIGLKEDVYHLAFVPQNNQEELFAAEFWIRKEDREILQIKLIRNELDTHPFRPIDPQHNINSLDFEIQYTFSGNHNNTLQKVAFSYEVDYFNGHNVRIMKSNGQFLFYDNNSMFYLPYYNVVEPSITDYERIVSQPYNAFFWDKNEIISPSQKSLAYQTYFQKNGVLLNFDKLSKIDQHHFSSRLKPWSEDRILLSELNNGENFAINPNQLAQRTTPLTNLYNLDAYIYLDRNAYEDTVVYLTRTMIDLKTSYYHLKPNKNTTCILNMYFDFIEIERRSLEETLYSRYWSEPQVDSIYAKMHQQMKYNLDYFWSAVEHGELDEEVLRYAKIINNHLHIDNTLLIWSDYMSDNFLEIKSTSEPWVQMYNYGTLCLKQGQYELALQSLEAAYEMGSRDPWLFYNLGLTYIKLNDIVKGCQFLQTSQELGEEVPDELISVCK